MLEEQINKALADGLEFDGNLKGAKTLLKVAASNIDRKTVTYSRVGSLSDDLETLVMCAIFVAKAAMDEQSK